MKEFKSKWGNITYDPALCNPQLLLQWKEEKCPKGWHLFDEMKSASEHALHCDACGLLVHIAYIETQDEAVARIDRDEERPPFVVIERGSHGI